MMQYGQYGYGSGYEIGHFFNIVITVLVIVFIISIIRRNRRTGHRGCWGGMCSRCEDNNSAIELLKERYVKGEIERAEFEQKKKDLMS